MQIVNGRIEEIGSGAALMLFGRAILKESPDVLCLSNRKPNMWVFSLLNGYRQIGKFEVKRPHNFKEGQDVKITLDDMGRVVDVEAE